MFERNTLYVLTNPTGLKNEPLLSNSNIVDVIVKTGNIIKPTEINSFGDVHAFKLANGKGKVFYIPREFIKYFEPVLPVAVEATNLIPFPKKSESVALPAVIEEPIAIDSWSALRIEAWIKPRSMGKTVSDRTGLPLEQMFTFEHKSLKQRGTPQIVDGKTEGILYPRVQHLHLEAKAV